MFSVGRLIFRTTGVMSNRGLAKNSRKIGEAIADVAKKSGGNIEEVQLEKILSDTIGKKSAKKIQFVDKDTFIAQARKNGVASEKELENSLDFMDAAAVADKYGGKGYVYIKKGAEDLNEKPGIVAHELQHALSFSFGKSSIPERFLGKFSLGRKYIDKTSLKMNSMGVQGKYLELYEDAFNNLRLGKNFDEGEIKNLLYSKGILKIGEDKKNARILKLLRKMYKDEVRSYTVQAQTNKAFGQDSYANVYEKFTENFKSLIKDIRQEEKHVRANRVRKFFGLKPDTAKEQEIICCG